MLYSSEARPVAAAGLISARMASWPPASVGCQGVLVGQALEVLQQQQRARYGQLYGATDARADAQAQAHASYMRHLGVARVALRDDRATAGALDLDAPRKRTRAGWLVQAQQFYTNLLADPALVAAVEAYGVTREQLTATQQAVAAVESGLAAQQSSRAAAREATQARDAALDALNRWMRDFQAIARVALAG